MKTLFKNEFCEIQRTLQGRLLRINFVSNTWTFIPSFINEIGLIVK